tara:strand:+ start:962 stop:1162 length:201 start_codon:yes stop_codon:yes gene_type:complete
MKMSQLTKYTDWACIQNTADLEFALADIKACWAANPEFEAGETNYSKKLWAERDAIITELQSRGGK